MAWGTRLTLVVPRKPNKPTVFKRWPLAKPASVSAHISSTNLMRGFAQIEQDTVEIELSVSKAVGESSHTARLVMDTEPFVSAIRFSTQKERDGFLRWMNS